MRSGGDAEDAAPTENMRAAAGKLAMERGCDKKSVTGWVQAYQINALGIAGEVCQCGEGLEPDLDGTTGRKIGVKLNWRRRGRPA